ncbi:MAG: hypothetical protein Q8755_02730 [Candidatus Phytoplasma australasiaticum]|nr:hypothetical protein [Candidatus Phytoplasma australasiaticum]
MSEVQKGFSYCDAVKGGGQTSISKLKTIVVEGNGLGYPNHCVGRSVIGTAKSLKAINASKQILNKAGFGEVGISYVGGLSLIITFKDRLIANEFVVEKANIWSSIFDDVYVWKGEITHCLELPN